MNSHSNVGRWMSEKLDGIRGYWDTARLISRNGNVFRCPDWFTTTLPTNMTLDGEIWMGRDATFVDVKTIVRSKNGDWKKLRYFLYDIPSSGGVCQERMKEMELSEQLWLLTYIL